MGSDKEWWSINITVWHTVVQEAGEKLLLFNFGLPIYQSGFIKVWDLSSFHNILHHRSVLNPSYKTDLNDLVTTWLLSNQLQCNSILLAYELPTFLKNIYKSCIGACENRHAPVGCFGIRVKSKCFFARTIEKKEIRPRAWQLLLKCWNSCWWEIYNSRCLKQTAVKHLMKGRKEYFYWIQAILNLALDEDPTVQNKLVFLPDHS